VAWLERAKIGKEPLSIFTFFTAPSTFNKCEQKSGLSEKRDNFPEAAKEPLCISQRLSYTLLAVPSSCSTAFKSISQQLSAKTWQFPSLFSVGPHFR
jgi:hypothetical protein